MGGSRTEVWSIEHRERGAFSGRDGGILSLKRREWDEGQWKRGILDRGVYARGLGAAGSLTTIVVAGIFFKVVGAADAAPFIFLG